MKSTPTLKQAKALEGGRAALHSKRALSRMMKNEIASLRSQVGADIMRGGLVSGINLRLGDIDEEYVPDLRRLSGRTRIFERMSNDPQVRGQLRAISMTLVSGVRWKVEGGAPEMRDLVASNLLGLGDPLYRCRKSWLELLYDSLGSLIYGFTMLGKVRELRGDRMVFADLPYLHPRSVDENGWRMDEADNLIEVWRSYADATGKTFSREPIAAGDIALLTWDRRGPNWEGNAFIRPMYKPWLLGEMAEKIEIIDLQNRGVGIPVAKLSGNGGAKERDTLIEILKSLRGGSKERAFVVLDKDESVEFLTSQGAVKDAGPVIAHHQGGIVKAAGTEYFESAAAGRAGAAALATGFFVNVDGVRVHLEDMWNRGIGNMPGLVEELIDMNFDNVKEYPRIVGSRVSPTEQLDNIPLIQDAIAKGAIPPSLKIANEMLMRLGWPEMTKAEWAEAMAAKAGPTLGPGSPAAGGPGRPVIAGPDPQGRNLPADVGLDDAEKKTSKPTRTGEILPLMRAASYPWLRSITA